MKRFYNQTWKEAINYKLGNLVLLKVTNFNIDRLIKKFDNKWYRPFEVLKKVGNSVYKLKLPASISYIYLVFNKVLLSLYYTLIFNSQPYITNLESIIMDKESE